jgi:PIN domain nuclease of toxin-antitoxin system
VIHLDTHIAARLASADRRLRRLQALLETEDVRVSPFVVLELQCLVELGRLSEPTQDQLAFLRENFGVEVDHHAVDEVVEAALGLSWTRDPFDRLIVGHAICAGAHLLTLDEMIHQHFPNATRG